jgi:hypothetical protein
MPVNATPAYARRRSGTVRAFQEQDTDDLVTEGQIAIVPGVPAWEKCQAGDFAPLQFREKGRGFSEQLSRRFPRWYSGPRSA